MTFDEAWREQERKGYRYGPNALEQVRFGWQLHEQYGSQPATAGTDASEEKEDHGSH